MKDHKVKITKGQGGKIKVIVPYNMAYIKKFKAIKGYGWNPEEKCRFFPKSDCIIEQIIDIFKTENLWTDFSFKKKIIYCLMIYGDRWYQENTL